MADALNEEVVVNEPVVEDRRDTIEKAFEAAEAEVEPAAPDTHTEPETPTESQAPEEPAPEEPATPAEQPQLFSIDKAPQSWRAPQKAKWEKLDPDIRQEVMRRERETTRVLGETSQARQFAQAFAQAVQPYQGRLQSIGAHPIQAVQELMKSDYILSTAPMPQKAAFMARLIKDYGIDIMALDSALSGTVAPADPVVSQVEQMVQQRLAPFQQFISQQQQREQLQQEQTTQQVAMTIEQMANDPKYPHFDELREDMADIIDIASKRGQYYPLEEAYRRAEAMNPAISKLVATQRQGQANASSAQAAHARAQRALAASVSVSGAPGSSPTGRNVGTDRRAAIEAAFDSLEGR